MSEPEPASRPELAGLFARQREAVAARRRSFDLPARRAALEALRQALIRHEAEIIRALQADFGKPEAETLLTEILPLRQEIRHAIRHLPRWMRDRRPGPTLATFGSSARIRREPRGICLIIAPWNYPLNLALSPLVSCLAAGNSAILKPSELAPATSALIARMVAGCFPPDLVQVVEGGKEVSTELLALPFDHIFFTGSPEVGKVVMTAAARHLSSVTLELGGKSPAVVGAEADVEQAADWIAFGKFANAGQTCIAPDHVHVHASRLDEVRAALQRRIIRAYGGGESPHLAGIISPRHAARLRDLLAEAQAGGARLWTADPPTAGQKGGEATGAADQHVEKASVPEEMPPGRPAEPPPMGRRLAPVLIEGATPGMRLMQEEIFGPLLPLLPFTELDQVITAITAQPKPLALYVFDRRREFSEAVIAATSSGGVGVNGALLHYSHHGLPFGGVNHSGLGQAHGEWGFRSFSHERAILTTRFSAVKLLFPPYTRAKLRLLRLVTRLLG